MIFLSSGWEIFLGLPVLFFSSIPPLSSKTFIQCFIQLLDNFNSLAVLAIDSLGPSISL
jgi:hypothetical protein